MCRGAAGDLRYWSALDRRGTPEPPSTAPILPGSTPPLGLTTMWNKPFLMPMDARHGSAIWAEAVPLEATSGRVGRPGHWKGRCCAVVPGTWWPPSCAACIRVLLKAGCWHRIDYLGLFRPTPGYGGGNTSGYRYCTLFLAT
jgi:hypothetical protein